MTSKAEKCRIFNEDVLTPIGNISDSLQSYYGMLGAKENKLLRGAGVDLEEALFKLKGVLDIFEAKKEKRRTCQRK